MWLATSHISSSLGNVVVVFAGAASLTAEEVGVTALVLAAYLLALSLVRGVVGDPALLTRRSGLAKEVAGASVILGALCAPVMLGLLWLLIPDHRALAVVVSMVLPFLLMQDGLRYIAFAVKKPKLSAVSDLLWLVLTAVPAGLIMLLGSTQIFALLGSWMAGGVAASFLLLKQLGGHIDLRSGWRSMRTERRLRYATTIDSIATNGVQQIALLFVAAFASLEATGAIRFLQACFGPVTLIFTTMYVDGIWSVRASREGSTDAVRGVAVRMSGALVISAAATFVVLRLLPGSVGAEVAGPTFAASREILLAFALAQVAACAGSGAMSGLRFASRAGEATRVRLLWASLLLPGTALGSSFAGASGFCVALLVANAVAGIVWWWRLMAVTPKYRAQLV